MNLMLARPVAAVTAAATMRFWRWQRQCQPQQHPQHQSPPQHQQAASAATVSNAAPLDAAATAPPPPAPMGPPRQRRGGTHACKNHTQTQTTHKHKNHTQTNNKQTHTHKNKQQTNTQKPHKNHTQHDTNTNHTQTQKPHTNKQQTNMTKKHDKMHACAQSHTQLNRGAAGSAATQPVSQSVRHCKSLHVIKGGAYGGAGAHSSGRARTM